MPWHGMYSNPSTQLRLQTTRILALTFADGLNQAMIIGKVDNTICWISLSPVVSAIGFSNTHPLNSDLSSGYNVALTTIYYSFKIFPRF